MFNGLDEKHVRTDEGFETTEEYSPMLISKRREWNAFFCYFFSACVTVVQRSLVASACVQVEYEKYGGYVPIKLFDRPFCGLQNSLLIMKAFYCTNYGAFIVIGNSHTKFYFVLTFPK